MGTLITTDEIELLIVGNYPDQRDYWLNRQVSASHTPITLPILCPKCRYQSVVTVKKRDELPGLLELECPRCLAIEGGKNGHLEIPLPFGKHRGEHSTRSWRSTRPTWPGWWTTSATSPNSLHRSRATAVSRRRGPRTHKSRRP